MRAVEGEGQVRVRWWMRRRIVWEIKEEESEHAQPVE